jgi:hypothetical protein
MSRKSVQRFSQAMREALLPQRHAQKQRAKARGANLKDRDAL